MVLTTNIIINIIFSYVASRGEESSAGRSGSFAARNGAAVDDGHGDATAPPPGTWSTVVQEPGQIVWIPAYWWHATCGLDDWTVAVGSQRGTLQGNKQAFASLDNSFPRGGVAPTQEVSKRKVLQNLKECGVELQRPKKTSIVAEYEFFNGDLGKYYDHLTEDLKATYDVKDLETLAVHRWLGSPKSTETHYELIYAEIEKVLVVDPPTNKPLRVLDAGCGVGGGLAWFAKKNPEWRLVGHTVSDEQYQFFQKVVKPAIHNFKPPSNSTSSRPVSQLFAEGGNRVSVQLKSYDLLEGEGPFDVIFSIEAMIHSTNLERTLKAWTAQLASKLAAGPATRQLDAVVSTASSPPSAIVIIDDFLSPGVSKTDTDVQLFHDAWLANVLLSSKEFAEIAMRCCRLQVVVDRDLTREFDINKKNYGNVAPDVPKVEGDGAKNQAEGKKAEHQGWLGAAMRKRLSVLGKLEYRLVVLRLAETVGAADGASPGANSAGITPALPENEKISPTSTVSEAHGSAAGASASSSDQPPAPVPPPTGTSAASSSDHCVAVPTLARGPGQLPNKPHADEIKPQLKTGENSTGGTNMECLSPWYCCGNEELRTITMVTLLVSR